jgi:Zn-dependent protease with chaperone function
MHHAAALLALTLALSLTTARDAGAQPRDRRPQQQEAPFRAQLAAIDPALVEIFDRATSALDAGRTEEARAGFEAVLRKQPRHAASLRRLSYADGSLGHAETALDHARAAFAADPGSDGKMALAQALLLRVDADAIKSARKLADEGYAEQPSQFGAALRAEVAARQNDRLALAHAVADLERLAPAEPTTHYFAALLALFRDEPGEAEAHLRRAVAAGFPAAAADRLREQTGLGRYLTLWRYAKLGAVGLGAWILGLFALYIFGRILSRLTLTAIERAAGNPAELERRTDRFRRVYRATIGFAAFYYYLSIPVVVVLVLAGAGGVVYGFLVLGYIPIKLLALVGIGAVVSVWAMIKSLFAIRGKEVDPGRRLPEAEAPALWALLREVAAKVGTRPVDAIFLTMGTDVGVSERGPLRTRLADRGERHLVLGIGVLSGFTLPALRAVLAHEYGHFSHRDTAGGDVAASVMTALLRSVIALAQRGGLLIINPAWHFLRGFHALFVRITLGASRLQEVLADQFAALAYGPRAFSEGLTHVIRRGITFERASALLGAHVEKERKPLLSLYDLPPGLSLPEDDVERAIAEALGRTGSGYDSHPPPSSRLKWVAQLPEPPAPAAAAGDAWSLFLDREGLEREMTSKANEALREAGVIVQAWPDATSPAPLSPPAASD